MHYLDFLKALHDIMNPTVYFEIGIRRGASLSLGRKTVIGVDPQYQIEHPLSADAHLFRAASDDFFASDDLTNALGDRRIDLAFIDGYHNFEFALRDFINTERYCGPSSVVVFDDVRPRTKAEAVREPNGRAWTGDVWRITDCLIKYRSDLQLTLVTTKPTGLLLATGLDPNSDVLRGQYASIEAEYVDPSLPLMPGADILDRFVEPAAALATLRGHS